MKTIQISLFMLAIAYLCPALLAGLKVKPRPLAIPILVLSVGSLCLQLFYLLPIIAGENSLIFGLCLGVLDIYCYHHKRISISGL